MLQATVCNSGTLDVQAFCEDGLSSPEVDISRSEVVEALVIADVVIVRDEGVDLPFEITGQIVVVQQDAALQGLVPTLNLTLGLRVIRRPTHMQHSLVLEPTGQIASHVRCAIVREKSWPVHDGGAIKARCCERQVEGFSNIGGAHGGTKLPGHD